MEIREEHALGLPEAKRRLNGFIDILVKEYEGKVVNPKYSWRGDVLEWEITIKKHDMTFSGVVTPTDTNVVLSIKERVPLLARLTVDSTVRAALRKALDTIPDPNIFIEEPK